MAGIPAHAIHEPQNAPLDELEPIPSVRNGSRIRGDAVLCIRVLNRRRELFLSDLLGFKRHRFSEAHFPQNEDDQYQEEDLGGAKHEEKAVEAALDTVETAEQFLNEM